MARVTNTMRALYTTSTQQLYTVNSYLAFLSQVASQREPLTRKVGERMEKSRGENGESLINLIILEMND
jgi:hypothetical protein